MSINILFYLVSALITLDGLSHLIISNSTIQNSEAQSIIFMGLVPNPVMRSTFFFDSISFTNNTGLYILNGNSINGSISQCIFSNNQLSPIYLINSNTYILSSIFENNNSSYSQIINYVDNDGISTSPSYELYCKLCQFVE